MKSSFYYILTLGIFTALTSTIARAQNYVMPNDYILQIPADGSAVMAVTEVTKLPEDINGGGSSSTPIEQVNCEEEAKDCDYLGYLQTAAQCSGQTTAIKCPFDDNRYFCGGRISPWSCLQTYVNNWYVNETCTEKNGYEIQTDHNNFCVTPANNVIYKLVCTSVANKVWDIQIFNDDTEPDAYVAKINDDGLIIKQ